MDALERYIADCENKRRRMRSRPSDMVVSQLRWLLDYVKTGSTVHPGPEPERVDPEGVSRHEAS